MKLITDEYLEIILEHYQDSEKDLILKQILKMEEIMLNNIQKYKNNNDFRDAINLIFKEVIEGGFVLRGGNDNDACE